MSVKNFVQCSLTTPVAAGSTELILVVPVAPYVLPPADGGVLVIADSVGRPTFVEVIRYTSCSGNVLYGVTRGQEGTTPRAWSGPTFIYQALTADEYTVALAGKEPSIVAGTAAQMWLGNKTWASVLSQVQGTLLTGLSLATGTAITAADTVLTGLGKLQKQITDAANNLAGNVRNTAITGYVVGSNTALAAADTVLGALGKIQGQLNGKQASLGYTAENLANKGVANGYAGLDATGKVPAVQLPSFVDDVLEFANLAGFPATGESGKIYVDLATNKSHRWSGSAYVEISASPGSTDAVTEGDANLYFTEGRVRATLLAGYAVGANAVLAAGDSVLGAFGKVQGQINDIVTSLAADVRAVILTGYAVGSNTALAATDTVLGAMGKLQGQINAAATNLQANVRATVLTGYLVGADTDLAAADTLLAALAKIQGQLNARAPLTGAGTSGSWPISVTGNAARARPQRSDNANWDLLWSDPGGQPTYYLGSSDGATVRPYNIANMNAGSATKLATARTINGVPFDGSANITIAGGETGRLPLTGGTMTGRLAIAYVASAAPAYNTAHMEISSGGANPPSISLHRPGYTAAVITHTGDGINVFSADGTTKAPVSASAFNGATLGLSGRATIGEALSSGWYRSTGAVGWYSESYGGGIFMEDSTYVRTYGGKSFKCSNILRVEGANPQVQLWDSDHSILRYLYADGGSVGFLSSAGGWSLINDNSGNTTSMGNVTAYSDIRLKKDIELIPDALDKVCALRGVTYERIDSGERQTGVIAQEVQAVLPEAVMTMTDEQQTLSVAYGNLVGLLIEAIKELKAEVDELKQGAK